MPLVESSKSADPFKVELLGLLNPDVIAAIDAIPHHELVLYMVACVLAHSSPFTKGQIANPKLLAERIWI